MKNAIFAVLLVLLTPVVSARTRYTTYATDGSTRVISNLSGTFTNSLRACPSSTVSVYLAGTSTLATIYSNSTGTIKPSTFTTTAAGLIDFWADDGNYKLILSGGDCTTRILDNITIGDGTLLDLSDYATGGAGTYASPWTGWDTAIPWAGTAGTGTISITNSTTALTGAGTLFTTQAAAGDWVCTSSASGRACARIASISDATTATVDGWPSSTVAGVTYTIYRPSTYNAPCGVFQFSSSLNLALPNLTLRGAGPCTVFKYTGSAKAFNLLGDYTGVLSGAFGIVLGDFTIKGSATTTDDLWLENTGQIRLENLYIHNATNSFLTVKDLVGYSFSNVRTTTTIEATLASPTYGRYFTNVWIGNDTDPIVDGCQYGIYATSANSISFTGGYSESNALYGAYITLSSRVAFRSTHFEGNPNAAGNDVFIALDSTYVMLDNISAQSRVTINGAWNTLIGGLYNNITLGSASGWNSFVNVPYTGTITDNGSTRSTYVGVTNRTSGAPYFEGLTTEGMLTARRDGVVGNTPGLSGVTGFGGSPTLAVDTASDSSMIFSITAGAGGAATGTITVTYSAALVGVTPVPIISFINSTGTWDTGVTYTISSSSATGFTINWNNNAVAVTNGQQYKVGIINIAH